MLWTDAGGRFTSEKIDEVGKQGAVRRLVMGEGVKQLCGSGHHDMVGTIEVTP